MKKKMTVSQMFMNYLQLLYHWPSASEVILKDMDKINW